MKEHETPENKCPYCDYKMDRATNIGSDHAPSPGDPSLCLSCASILIFKEDLTLRAPYNQELNAMYKEQPGLEKYLTFLQTKVREFDRRNVNTPNK